MRGNRDLPAETCRDLLRGLGPGTACVAVTPGKAFACALPPFYVSMEFLTDPSVMPLIYAAQFAAILGAHVLSVVLTSKLAGQGTRATAHLPLTVLMVAYTVLGLWLLSTARTG